MQGEPIPTVDENVVCFYEREFYCFSNFSSFSVVFFGQRCMTSEHAYQAIKFSRHPSIADLVVAAPSAHDAKKIAHQHKTQMHPDWNELKVPAMTQICRAKLAQHPYIQKKLLETGDRLIVEDSPTDSFWGWGPDRNGQNELGKIWMKLRSELRERKGSMTEHVHPHSGATIEGERLGPGCIIQQGDCYDSTDGTWALAGSLTGLTLQTFNSTIWVRPTAGTGHIAPAQ